jgi:spore coat protein X
MSDIDTWLFGKRRCSKPWSFHDDEGVFQEADQVSKFIQKSYEEIVIKDSTNVLVATVDAKVAVSLQAAIQAAIALVISLSIADGHKAEAVTQELLQKTKSVQINRQRTFIENSRNVLVATIDVDLLLNIQLLLQLLLVLVASLDIL